MVISLVLAVSLAVAFGALSQYIAFHFDHPRARAGLGYKKVGIIPVSHHIPEIAYFVFVGWALQIILPLVGIPSWLVYVIVVAFTFLLYFQSNSLKEKYNLPDEPRWHVVLVLVLLDIALLAGFYTPWPSL